MKKSEVKKKTQKTKTWQQEVALGERDGVP